MQFVDRRTVLAGALAAGAIGTAARSAMPLETDAVEILRRRVEVEKRAVGMAVAMVSHRGRRIVCAGRERLSDDRRISGETVFEIASITKVFTALLLANSVRSGKVALDDPATKHLPAGFILPERDGRPITLADLATHTAGLPRFPPVEGRDLTSYFRSLAQYSVADLKAWLAGFQLTRAPGAGWEYSNAGYALLGLALSHRADRPFDELLQRELLDPLGLASTFLNPPARVAARVAEGHDEKLKAGPPFEIGIFAPAGGLRSTANDLARFIRAVIPGTASSIEASARLLLEVRRPAPAAGGQQALGWEMLSAREGEYISKDGVSPYQCASAVLDLVGRKGVIVLSNTAANFRGTDTSPSGGGIGAADVARHLLRPSIPLGA